MVTYYNLIVVQRMCSSIEYECEIKKILQFLINGVKKSKIQFKIRQKIVITRRSRHHIQWSSFPAREVLLGIHNLIVLAELRYPVPVPPHLRVWNEPFICASEMLFRIKESIGLKNIKACCKPFLLLYL